MISFLIRSTLVIGLLYLTSAQITAQCEINSFSPPDTLSFVNKLGDCQVLSLEVLDSLDLSDCNQVQLIPSGPYDVGAYTSIVIYDKNKDSIYSPFILISTPQPIDQLIEYPMGAGECEATKEMVLDQLNVPNDEIIRSQIQFLQGSTRISSFPIGGITRIDAITCDGITFYQDIDVAFTPTVSTFEGVKNIDIGLTSCKLTIEDILNEFDYDVASCSLDRFSISDQGPFGYGDHFIEYIKLDNFYILKNSIIHVHSTSECNINDIPFGQLEQGKCALNEEDIIIKLGLDNDGCSTDGISFIPPGPYESSPVEIREIIIDEVIACTAPFNITFQRDTTTIEQGSLICHQDLNIAMDTRCEVRMNADVILSNGNYCYLNYIIDLAWADDPANILQSGHEVVVTMPGRYSLVITNPNTGNSCWAEFQVEDKFIEDIRCTPDTLWCYESIDLVPDDTTGGGPDFPDLGPGIKYLPSGEERSYNVTTATLCDVAFARYEDEVVEFCLNGYKEVIARLWTFEDNFGNSDTCIQKLYIRNTTLDLVEDFDRLEVNCIDDFEILDNNGNPAPESSGYPRVAGNNNADVCGTLKMTYNDAAFPLCGNGMKIHRRWVIIDWCSDQVMELDQVIRIEDKEGPVILDDLEDLSIDSDPFICGGSNIDLPLPNYEDCNIDEVNLEIIYETYNASGNLITRSNGSSLLIDEILTFDIVSTFRIEYVLTDPCGNESRDTLMLTITDNEAPVAVCDEYTVISVAGNGQALVMARTFDDLSVDNCGILKYEARKKSGYCDLTNEFTDRIRFCCEEVGDTIMVEFRVTDLAGNYNTCDVLVSVQDKFKPIITCPDDIRLDCKEDYLNLEITGTPDSRDNCTPLEIRFEDDLNLDQCYQGTIRRIWTVRDRGGFEESCVQIITIEEDDPFIMTQTRFPPDTTIIGCTASLDPEFVGKPDILTLSCAMVDATFSDLFFYDVENACLKILREWTVIDWCQRNETNSGIWKEDQIIKLISLDGPVFQNDNLELTHCITGVDCSTEIEIEGFAIDGDSCTPEDELKWSFEIYNSAPTLVASGNSKIATAILDRGLYTVIYSAIDGCDNKGLDTIAIEIIDCQSPELSCPNVQPSLVLDTEGKAVLGVEAIVDISISDNCDDSSDIMFSFDKLKDSTEVIFSCDQLTNGLFDGFIKLYAIDQSGNVDSCDLFVEVRDNSNNMCGGDPQDSLLISGMITTEEHNEVEDVAVTLIAQTGEISMATTESGQYSFGRLKPNSQYNVKFEKNTDHGDGVSTLDLVLTQRHILAIKGFDTPYQTIAADVDNNGRVSSIDLVRMRRVILGLDSLFDVNGQQSWRFVEVAQNFNDPLSPFPFVEQLNVKSLDHSLYDMDFMAVKIGDVNGSNSISSRIKSGSRNGAVSVKLQMENGIVHFIATRDAEIGGLQFVFDGIDDKPLHHVVGGVLDINQEHYNLKNNYLGISWIAQEGSASVRAGDILFSIVVDDDYDTEELIENFITNNSEWISDNLDLQFIKLENLNLEDYDNPIETNITSVSNSPNPFIDYTNINFNLKQEGEINIRLCDVTGSVLYQQTKFYNKGDHSIPMSSEVLHNKAGVYFLQLTAGVHSHVHKITYLK